MTDEQQIVEFQTYIVGNPWKNWVFLVLHTDAGFDGVGEASLNGFALTTEIAIRELARYFVGRSPFELSRIRDDMLEQVYSDGGQIHRSAAAAVEGACWDIVGKTLGHPVHALWGGRGRDAVPLYANGWYRTERDPEAFADKARQTAAAGYAALKVDPFGACRGACSGAERDLALRIISAVRAAVPSARLFIEGHGRFDVPTALELAAHLADHDVGWFEEPVPHWNRRGLAEVAQRSPVKIATGENFTRAVDFVDLSAETANLVLQPDVMNLGGLSEARRVCDLAEARGLPVAPHDAQGPISKAMCLQLAGTSSAVAILEDFEPFNEPWTHLLASPLERMPDGQMRVPSAPGLGRTLHLEEVARHPYDRDAVLELFTAGWERRRTGEARR